MDKAKGLWGLRDLLGIRRHYRDDSKVLRFKKVYAAKNGSKPKKEEKE